MTALGRPLPEDWGFWERLWLQAPAATETAKDTDWMFMALWWFCVVWFVLLMGLMTYFVVKYRRRPGRIAPNSASHNGPLEVAWTIVPTIFLVIMFFMGMRGYMDKMVAPGDALELRLTGYKWSWDLEYPNGVKMGKSIDPVVLGSQPIPVFYVPAETPIRLRMNSIDVLHAFWIPDFRIKQDLVPNRYTSLWFKAEAPAANGKVHPASLAEAQALRDRYPLNKALPDFTDDRAVLAGVPFEDHIVYCAEYCGTEHSEMWAIIRVVPYDGYQKWMSYIAKKTRPSDPVELGKLVYKSRCASCHSVDGSKNTGPTWLDTYGAEHEMTDGSKVLVDENYIRQSIRMPAARIVKGYPNGMSVFSEGIVSEDEVNGVIAYMKTISKFAPAPVDGPAGEAKATEPEKKQAP